MTNAWRALCAGMSAVAIGGFVLFEQHELEPDATTLQMERIKDDDAVTTREMPPSVGGTPTVSSAVSASTRVQLPGESPPPTLISLPDFSGLTARRAVALARQMGLRLSIADSDGEVVAAERISNVRIASDHQRPVAGTLVGPNDRVRIRVRGHYVQSVRLGGISIGY